MKNHIAFSLVELIIVIAIVALLSAIAVPAYQQYSLKTKIASYTPPMDAVIKQAMVYSLAHNGRIPNFQELGYADTDAGGLCLGATTLAAQFPGATEFCVRSQAVFGGNPCTGHISMILDASLLPGNLDIIELRCGFGTKDGVAKKNCFYSAATASKSISDLSLPGWISYYSNSTFGASYYNSWYVTHGTFTNAYEPC